MYDYWSSTPEFINEKNKEFIFVCNHALEADEQVTMSIQYNLLRVKFTRSQLSSHISNCRIIYDIRGQLIDVHIQEKIVNQLSLVASVEFKE
ncbi:hypothetical protein [Acinetobacter haemolyticus]|uniref:hypothetical protein n=1 Tax=Acinetobacter haemolyticus TaxID=29430 RepID=UPI0013737086|nr:hypothetical protein [Acinetobacter haemolyticus]NAS00206.1 hypothetical protein [Acinetobacter haemolyticus]